MRAVTLTLPVPRIVSGAFVPYTFFVVVLALLFGGGARQGLWSDALVEWASLPLLIAALFKLERTRLHPSARWGLALLAAVFVLPFLQLIPLPPSVWTHLPGRQVFASTYATAGIDLPWLSLSLDPAATWAGLLALLPAAAVFVAMLSLERSTNCIFVGLLLVFALVSVPIDLLQAMDGPESSLRFYAITNLDRAVGFFANSNHNAAFLYSAIPFVAAWAIVLSRSHSQNRTFGLLFLSALIAAVMIGLALAQSRAGIGLGFVAGLSALLLAWRQGSGKLSRRLLLLVLGANIIAFLIAFQFGFVAIMQRVETSAGIEDLRWPVARITYQAAINNLPFGTGFGTFVAVYDMFAPLNLLGDRYVNHAHNDWLELLLVGGVPALLLVGAFLVWFMDVSVGAWRRNSAHGGALDIAFARAASIAIILLLVHSFVDYPLRTIAISTLFAIGCGLLAKLGLDFASASEEDRTGSAH